MACTACCLIFIFWFSLADNPGMSPVLYPRQMRICYTIVYQSFISLIYVSPQVEDLCVKQNWLCAGFVLTILAQNRISDFSDFISDFISLLK